MALSIGELTGTIGLDASPFQGGLDKVSGMLSGVGGKWTGILAATGLAVGAAFGGSLLAAMDTQQAVGKVTASLGLTEKQSARVGKVAGRLYSQAYGESVGEVSVAVESVMSSIAGMANASGKDLERVTGKALTFADAFEVDIDRAAQVAGQMIRTGLAKNADEAFDLLTRASQKVPKALREDVLDATDEYGQFFAAVGIDGPKAMGILAEGAAKGMYGIDKAGDAVKEFSIRATDMSAASGEAYAALGMSQEDMTNKLLAGGETAGKATQQIIDGLLNITDPAAQSQAALALFGTPLEDLNTQDIPKFLGSLQSGSKGLDDWRGSTDKAGKALKDNAATNLTKFTRQIKTGILGVLGGKAIPAVTAITAVLATGLGPAFNAVGDAIGAATGFLSDHSTAVSIIAGVIGTLLLPALIAAGVQATISAAKQVAAWAVSGAAALASRAMHVVSLTLIAAGWVRAGAMAMAGAVRMAASWLVALGPIGWAIAAIAVVVAVVIKYWDQIAAFTSKAWSKVTGAVSAAVKWLVGFVKTVPAKLASFFLNWTLPGLIVKHWSTIKAKTVSIATSMIQWVKGIPGKVASGMSSLGSRVASIASSAFGQLKSRAADKARDLVAYVRELPGRIKDAFGNASGMLSRIGGQIVGGLVAGIRNAAGSVSDMVGRLVDKIPSKIRKLLGIASPSKVTTQLGEWTGEGLARGIGNSTRMVTANAADLAASASAAMQDNLAAASMSGLTATGGTNGMPSTGTRGGTTTVIRETRVVERGPLIGQVVQQPGESTEQLAERQWALTKSRG